MTIRLIPTAKMVKALVALYMANRRELPKVAKAFEKGPQELAELTALLAELNLPKLKARGHEARFLEAMGNLVKAGFFPKRKRRTV